MIFSRAFAMPHSETFLIKPIREFLARHVRGVIVDPFARNNTWATFTNDLDPSTQAGERGQRVMARMHPNDRSMRDSIPAVDRRVIDGATGKPIEPAVNKKFSIGDPVRKTGGDYRFEGEVRAAFTKISGAERYVVEDDRGVLHIFSEKNLEPQ